MSIQMAIMLDPCSLLATGSGGIFWLRQRGHDFFGPSAERGHDFLDPRLNRVITLLDPRCNGVMSFLNFQKNGVTTFFDLPLYGVKGKKIETTYEEIRWNRENRTIVPCNSAYFRHDDDIHLLLDYLDRKQGKNVSLLKNLQVFRSLGT